MYSVSAAFLAQIAKSHRMLTRAELYVAGAFSQTLDIVDGQVTVQDADIRRTMYVTLSTSSMVPTNVHSALAPAGNEIKLFRGVRIDATGTSELVPLGVYGINDVKIYDSGDGLQIRVEGADRARKVQRARFPTEYSIAAGTNYATAIQNLITNRYPAATFNFVTTTLTTPLIVFKAGDDPWKSARSMAADMGCDLYFDVNGVCTLVNVPVLSSQVSTVASYVEGPGCTFMYLNRRLTDTGVYSHVVVTGENNGTTAPVRGEALDNNPQSSTYYLGPFGDVVYFQASSFITTAAQAAAAAQARLSKLTGFPELIEMQAIVNPAHDIGDVIQVTRSVSRVNNKYVINKIGLPLSEARAMDLATRQGVLAA